MQYTFVKAADILVLRAELAANKIAVLISSVDINLNTVVVTTTRSLSDAEQQILYKAINDHIPNPAAHDKIQNRILGAMEFGKSMVLEFATRNVLRGLSTTDIAHLAGSLAPVQLAFMSGSLNVALLLISQLKPDGHLLTASDIEYFTTKIKQYLSTL